MKVFIFLVVVVAFLVGVYSGIKASPFTITCQEHFNNEFTEPIPHTIEAVTDHGDTMSVIIDGCYYVKSTCE